VELRGFVLPAFLLWDLLWDFAFVGLLRVLAIDFLWINPLRRLGDPPERCKKHGRRCRTLKPDAKSAQSRPKDWKTKV
jgi:hypothetical protein